ncbi:MAG TPA: hypothetical protein VHN17_07505 [Steroidobacteraceae bacterium]|jgi:hypothetical protein|nr:hypothetical protein [Steroidobacteraceae bacterium]
MALHQVIQRLLLVGVRFESLPAPAQPRPPPRLVPLIESIAAAHRNFDRRAIYFGHRYRSGFWAIYLLSAIAVLCAVMPLALGWDSTQHAMHPFSGLWAVAEVLVIGSVSAIYWLGHRHDWQGQWLRARTTAELTWYLPLIAPLIDFSAPQTQANWYLRVLDPGQHLGGADDVAALCARSEPQARALLAQAWSDPEFVQDYAQWTIAILQAQKHYHACIAVRQHALLHRVHRVTSGLFGLTALGAMMHLLLHTLWLTLVTTFFPALGASLHGALAQSEAYRLGATSERLVHELQAAIDDIRTALARCSEVSGVAALKASVEAAISLIVEEHQDWQMLVRPHHLPLA